MPQHRGQSAEMQFATGSEDFIPIQLGEELELAHSGCNGKWLPITKDPIGFDVPTKISRPEFHVSSATGNFTAKNGKGV